MVATVKEVRLVLEDRLVARHRRCWERERALFEPIHYLALLEREPGGFDYARPNVLRLLIDRNPALHPHKRVAHPRASHEQGSGETRSPQANRTAKASTSN